MIDKKNCIGFRRPYFPVDPNADILAGMVAFLNDLGQATTSGGVRNGIPIGTFWKNSSRFYAATTIEYGTFGVDNTLTLDHGNMLGHNDVKVTSLDGLTVYDDVTDYGYTTRATPSVITRLPGGIIPATATVIIWYQYYLTDEKPFWSANAGITSLGQNYDAVPNDTLGSGSIAVLTGHAEFFTDVYDVHETYQIGDALRSTDDFSLWTNSAHSGLPICGKVTRVPTVDYPFLGVQQMAVAS